MLTGRPAFPGSNIHEILLKNKKGDVLFPPKYWDKISPDAKDLVIKMLHKDPRQRINAKDALDHPWFHNESQINNVLEVSENIGNLQFEMRVDKQQLNDE